MYICKYMYIYIYIYMYTYMPASVHYMPALAILARFPAPADLSS